MHDYEVHVLVNGILLKVKISATSPSQARQIAKAQYCDAKMINVIRRLD
ncbi:MAG: hypothetical protein IKB25_05075 [Lentisphaeria bacterium]|nr:hypothetical protein [Lentisphaeria bacterium]